MDVQTAEGAADISSPRQEAPIQRIRHRHPANRNSHPFSRYQENEMEC